MPFIPHTDSDTKAMLETIGVADIETLFDEVPGELRSGPLTDVPDALSELEVTRLMERRAAAEPVMLSFLGAGAYEHHIPAAVWEIAARGEYYSAYTPYQAEASQGTLQVIYEYQTMMSALTGLDVSNASLYDGATALAEAVLMAVRSQRKARSNRVLLPRNLHPHYLRVVETLTSSQGIELVPLPYDADSGRVDCDALSADREQDCCAIVIAQPNVFGVLEDVDGLTDWANERGVLPIALVNPTSLGLLKPPGEWGRHGAALACGEGQPLGVPLAGGGPYFGFLCCRETLLRQLPGRLVGRTVDADGRPGFTLTLQAREQHIRRSRATSNICTNQGLMVVAATIYMSLMGPEGLRRVAAQCHARTAQLARAVGAIPGVAVRFSAPHFHELVLELPVAAAEALEGLAECGILGGVSLERWYPELANAVLVCATETKTAADVDLYAKSLRGVLR